MANKTQTQVMNTYRILPNLASTSHLLAPHSIMNCTFSIKTPADCMLAELFYFYLLVKKGNKVSTIELTQKIYSCQLLAFCYLGNRLVGISAIKRPAQSYIMQVHKKAGIVRNINNYALELGYSYTELEFRQMGISRMLKAMLLSKISQQGGMLFATTAVPTSKRFLISSGFIPYGNPYQGIFDDGIVYFEKRISS